MRFNPIVLTVSMVFLIALTAVSVAARTGQDASAPVTLFAVLRPGADGQWFIQNDKDHAPYGIDPRIEQTDEAIHTFFGGVATFQKVGAIQISSDDGFGDHVTGHANVGLTGAVIEVWAAGHRIDPTHAPDPENGNFWVTVQMFPE